MTQREKANFACFEDLYLRGQLPVTRAIEHRVCGCTYGATSWATREEAELVASALRLGPAVRLLEIGAGACERAAVKLIKALQGEAPPDEARLAFRDAAEEARILISDGAPQRR